MQDFEFVSARQVKEVVSLLADPGRSVRVLSGGTDLLVQLREGRRTADVIVDVKSIPDLNQLTFNSDEGLVIGAAVSCRQLCQDPVVRELFPGLIDGISIIGGTQIQGRATIGGNLCNASPAADSTPALIVHRAVCRVAGQNGMREIPVEDFFTGPGMTVLEPGELLVSIRVPPSPERCGARYLRFIPRNEMDIAVVGAGASVVLSEDLSQFVSARIALGAVAPTPLFVREAGEFLAGRTVTADAIHEAARIAQAAARPISDMRGTADQRRHLVLILTRRALNGAVNRALGLDTNPDPSSMKGRVDEHQP